MISDTRTDQVRNTSRLEPSEKRRHDTRWPWHNAWGHCSSAMRACATAAETDAPCNKASSARYETLSMFYSVRYILCTPYSELRIQDSVSECRSRQCRHCAVSYLSRTLSASLPALFLLLLFSFPRRSATCPSESLREYDRDVQRWRARALDPGKSQERSMMCKRGKSKVRKKEKKKEN